MTKSQTVWVAEQLEKSGHVTRNQALRKFITRLAARINDLKEAGWEIDSKRMRTTNGVDHIYTLISKPQ